MREISIAQSPVKKDDSLEKVVKGLENSLVKAIQKIPAPVVHNEAATVELKKEDRTYLITVNRDDHGRVQSMLVKPYEPS